MGDAPGVVVIVALPLPVVIGHPIAMEAVEQPTAAKLGEHVAAIASPPACDEHAPGVAVAQNETVPAVQRAPTSPNATLAPGVAERCSDCGGVHDAPPRSACDMEGRFANQFSASSSVIKVFLPHLRTRSRP
jgi:hypothetical protein